MPKPNKPTVSKQTFIDNSKGLRSVSSGTPMPKIKPAQPTAQSPKQSSTAKKGS